MVNCHIETILQSKVLHVLCTVKGLAAKSDYATTPNKRGQLCSYTMSRGFCLSSW